MLFMNSQFRRALWVTLLLAGGWPSAGWAQTLDQYGGYAGLSGHNASGFFRIEKIGDRCYLITPDNHAMISIAMTGILYYDSWGAYCPPINSSPSAWAIRARFNNDQTAWQAAMKADLASWGFNGIGAWSQQDIPNMTENAVVLGITGVATGAGVPKIGRNFADVWHPTFAAKATQQANSLTSYASSRFRIGAFPDNELGWVGVDAWGTGGDKLPDGFIKLPATAYGKKYWANTLLAGKYATIADLNAAYGTAFTSFAGSESTSLVNVTALPNDPAHPAIFADKQDFMEAIANQYYSTVSAAMRAKDPNHLVFSSRWAFWTTGYDRGYPEQQAYNERVWRAEGRYCDIIAVNGYPHTDWLEANHQFYSRMFAANGGKPFMITEYNGSANDPQFPFRDPACAAWQLWCTYPFQRYRGEDYVSQMTGSLDLALNDPNGGGTVHPYLGLQWFYYVDEPSLGRPDGEGTNCGLLNVPGEAYSTAVDLISSFNAQMYGYLVNGSSIQLVAAPVPTSPPVPPVFSSASATSTLPGWVPASTIDRSPYSVWSSTEQSQFGSQNLTINFSAPANLLALLIRPRSFTDPSVSTFPRDFRIQYYGGSQWQDLPGHVYDDYPNPGSAVQCFACSPPVVASSVRIVGTEFSKDDTGKYFMQIADVWAVAGSAQPPLPTFSWSATAGAGSYCLLYSPDQTFPDAQTVRIEGLTSISYTPAQALSPGLWYWCVRAVSPAGLGGKYTDPIPFWVDATGTAASPTDALGMEDLTLWQNVPREGGGWDGTVWAFRDTAQRTTGNASARVVFTMNSMNKLTGAKNQRTGRIVWRYLGPSLYYPAADRISFDLMTSRASDSAGTVKVASRFISLRVADETGQTLLDTPIDPAGAVPPLAWQNLSFALATPHGRHIASIEFYVDMTVADVPWDQRMTVWLDNLVPGPATSRADFDLDLDVDQADFGHLQACLTGWGVPQNDPNCQDARLDADNDVDQDDLNLFLPCMSPAAVAADPNCPGQ